MTWHGSAVFFKGQHGRNAAATERQTEEGNREGANEANSEDRRNKNSDGKGEGQSLSMFLLTTFRGTTKSRIDR